MKPSRHKDSKVGGRFQESARVANNQQKTTRVVIYARVSSQKQLDNKEEDSIKSQIRHNRRFAETFSEAGEKWIIVKVIIDDGRTGRNDKRDGLREVRQLVKTGQVDVVLVNRLSRAFRNTKLAHEFEDFLQNHDARLVSRMEPGNTDTASDKLVRSMHHTMAEFASNQISEDVKRSIQTRREEGLTSGGTPKPGYDSHEGHLFVVEEDAAIVREIFEMAENGMAPTEIANDLNLRRIRTRKRTSKRGITTGGNRFRSDGIKKLLRDPIYKGVLVHEGIEYNLISDPVVSKEVWDKIQVALDRRPKKKVDLTQKRDKNFLPLKGIIRCVCCNSAMKPTFTIKRKANGSIEKYFYYLCSKHEKMRDESTCKIGSVPARLLEKLLMVAFSEIAANPEVAKRLIEKAPKAKTAKVRELSKQRQAIRKQLKELDVKVETLTEKFLQVAGTAMGDKIRIKNDELTAQKNDLIAEEIQFNQEIDALKSDMLSPERLQGALSHFAEAVKCLSEDEQRELYKLLFKSVIVKEGGKAKDPVNGNTRHKRDDRRHLSVEVRLRTEAVHSLFGEAGVTGKRKSGFNIPLEIAHCLKKPMESCAILSPVYKECGHKAPKTRKRPKKTEHEIHRAIRWREEMDQLGIDKKSLAKKLGLSKVAVTHVMNWLKLSNGAQRILLQLSEPNQIRSISRKARNLILKEQSESAQVKKIEEIISDKQ